MRRSCSLQGCSSRLYFHSNEQWWYWLSLLLWILILHGLESEWDSDLVFLPHVSPDPVHVCLVCFPTTLWFTSYSSFGPIHECVGFTSLLLPHPFQILPARNLSNPGHDSNSRLYSSLLFLSQMVQVRDAIPIYLTAPLRCTYFPFRAHNPSCF